jgi:hypothetical protein
MRTAGLLLTGFGLATLLLVSGTAVYAYLFTTGAHVPILLLAETAIPGVAIMASGALLVWFGRGRTQSDI